MSKCVPKNNISPTSFLFCCHLEKTAAESHRMLVEAYGRHALCETPCMDWFRKFSSDDYDVQNEDHRKNSKTPIFKLYCVKTVDKRKNCSQNNKM